MNEVRFCKRCDDNREVSVGSGTKVHAGRLVCATCGCFITWIKKSAAEFYDIPLAKDEDVEVIEQPKQKRLF